MLDSKQETPNTNGDQSEFPSRELPQTEAEYRDAVIKAYRLGWADRHKKTTYQPKPGDGWNSLFYCFGTISFLLVVPIFATFIEFGYFPNSTPLVWLGLGSGVSGAIAVFCSFMERKVLHATGKS